MTPEEWLEGGKEEAHAKQLQEKHQHQLAQQLESNQRQHDVHYNKGSNDPSVSERIDQIAMQIDNVANRVSKKIK